MIHTGIWTNEPLFKVGYANNGTTGTVPFFKKIGPWIGVTVGIEDFWFPVWIKKICKVTGIILAWLMVNLWYFWKKIIIYNSDLILKRAFHCKEVVKMYLSGFNIILFKYLFYFLIILMLRVHLSFFLLLLLVL